MLLTRPTRLSALTPLQVRPVRAAGEHRMDAIERHVRCAPVLWLLGGLHLSLAVLLAARAARAWPRGALVNAIAGLWLATGALQMLSSLANGLLREDLSLGVRNAFSLTSLGWIIAGLSVAAGATSALTLRQQGALFARLAIYTLLLGLPILAALSFGVPAGHLQSPVSSLLGQGEFVQAFTSIQLSVEEYTFGATIPRLILMYPWAPALGIGSLGLLLISTAASRASVRAAGMAGAAFGVVFSWSRLAIVLAIASMCVLAVLRWPPRARLGLALVLLLGLATLSTCSGSFHLAGQGFDAISSVRPGSSEARELIYLRSWQGFLDSPWIGWGWVGASVHPIEHLPIGSHSSVFGTLYTGGVLVFITFAAAMVLTLGALLRVRPASPGGAHVRNVALCLHLVLCVTSLYEALYSLALPCYFYFFFIGRALRTEPVEIPREPPRSTPLRRLPVPFTSDQESFHA